MPHLLFVVIAAFVGYLSVTATAVYLLRRFAWVSSVREVRPRQCGQHLLSYGVLLAYLVFCAKSQHDAAFFYSDLSLAAS